MSTSNGLAARDDQLFNPGSWSKTYTVVGLTVGASTTWHARIVAKEGDDQSTASLLTPTVTVDSGANTVTFSLTSTQVATLLSTGARKFHGFWSVYNDTLARQLVTGSYVVDRTAGNSGTTTTPGTLTVTSTTTTLTVLSEQAAYSSKVSIFAVSDYGTLDLTGATDMTSIVQAAITAAAATGGTVVFPAGIIKCTGQLTVPADGTGAISNGAVKQRPVKLTGAGGFATGQVGTFVGGTRLRLTYAGSSYNDAKFVTYGLGHLAIEDITFEDTTANATTPFLYTTLTTLHVNRCAFIGATADTPAQDAIVLGGTTKPVSSGYGSTDAGFQGYGTTITNCYFNNVRRIVFGRSFCNQTQVAWNFADKGCGTNLAGGACIEFNGSLPATEAAVADSDYCTNNVIMGNYLEAPNYVYLVKLVKCISTGVIANGFVDPAGGGYVAGVRCEGAVSNGVNYPTTDTMLLGNYGWNGIVLSEDSMSTDQNNVIGGMQAQGNKFARGPLTLNDQTLALKTTGPVTLGKFPNLIQPDASPGTDGAVLFNMKRSAAEATNPGQTFYQITQDGQITFKDHNLNGFVFDPGAGTFQATTAKNITWDCNGGGAIVNKGASFAYQDHFGGGERVAFTYNAAQDGGQIRLGGASGPLILNGTATPEGSRTAPVGSLFLRTDGAAGTTLYRKESGTGNTGWKSGGARTVSTVTTAATVTTSTAEQTLVSMAIPTTALAGETYVIDAWGEFTNNSGGSVNYTWKAKLGATTILTSPAQAYGTSASKHLWNLRAVVLVKTTASELVKADLQLGAATADTWQQISTNSLVGNGTAAEDLTAGKSFIFTGTMGTSSASASLTISGATLTLAPT